MRPLVDHGTGHLLVEDPSIAEYYLPAGSQWRRWSSTRNIVLPSGASTGGPARPRAWSGAGNAAAFAKYINSGYFSLVALNFTDTTALDHRITADLHRNPHYRIVEVVPYGEGPPSGAGYLRDLAIRAATVSSTGHASLEPLASTVTSAPRYQQQPGLVLPRPPDDDEKFAYIYRNLPYLATILVIGAGCLIISQVRFEMHNPALWPFMIFTATYVIYQAISLPVNFTGRGFDLAAHQARSHGWRPASYPSVDIFLPICGEPMAVLRNAWTRRRRPRHGLPRDGDGICPRRRAVR